jgi:hypothetical protein
VSCRPKSRGQEPHLGPPRAGPGPSPPRRRVSMSLMVVSFCSNVWRKVIGHREIHAGHASVFAERKRPDRDRSRLRRPRLTGVRRHRARAARLPLLSRPTRATSLRRYLCGSVWCPPRREPSYRATWTTQPLSTREETHPGLEPGPSRACDGFPDPALAAKPTLGPRQTRSPALTPITSDRTTPGWPARRPGRSSQAAALWSGCRLPTTPAQARSMR